MLEKYLENHIKVLEQVGDWKESIRIAAMDLLEKDYISQHYIESMIENVVVNGTYIIILPQIAIPHSRPETGAFKTSMSLLKLNQPVLYPEDKEVSLIIVLAASDNESHLELIALLSELLENRELLNQLFKAPTAEHIQELINQVEV